MRPISQLQTYSREKPTPTESLVSLKTGCLLQQSSLLVKVAPEVPQTEWLKQRYCQRQFHLILPSLYSTCLRATGSNFRTFIFSVMVRAFFRVT